MATTKQTKSTAPKAKSTVKKTSAAETKKQLKNQLLRRQQSQVVSYL